MSEYTQAQTASEEARKRLHLATKALDAAQAEFNAAQSAADEALEKFARLTNMGPA